MSQQDQIDYWNGEAGRKWVAHARHLDAMLLPFAEAVVDAARPRPGEAVLDVGCGAGALTLMAAERVGPVHGATGLDVSEPLLALARERAQGSNLPARFELGDAAAWRARAPVDVLVSRFGVMFFEDPVAAFANLRASVKPGGRLAFACWQALSENAWALAPLQAALPYLAEPPSPPPPGMPGPFAFAERAHVSGVLSDAGWHDVAVVPWSGAITLPGEGPHEIAAFMIELGPVARLLAAQEADLAPVEAALRARMAELAGKDGRVALPAAAWIVTALA